MGIPTQRQLEAEGMMDDRLPPTLPPTMVATFQCENEVCQEDEYCAQIEGSHSICCKIGTACGGAVISTTEAPVSQAILLPTQMKAIPTQMRIVPTQRQLEAEQQSYLII